jgi:hypothetical protein
MRARDDDFRFAVIQSDFSGHVWSNAMVRSNYAAFRQGPAVPDLTKRLPAGPQCSTQRAGIAPPHAEGDGLSGATSDRETFAFISGPAGVVGGVPLTRAMNPWAMPAAST